VTEQDEKFRIHHYGNYSVRVSWFTRLRWLFSRSPHFEVPGSHVAPLIPVTLGPPEHVVEVLPGQTTTWTVPENVTEVSVHTWSGGSGGGAPPPGTSSSMRDAMKDHEEFCDEECERPDKIADSA
jgi:hypothetical protein